MNFGFELQVFKSIPLRIAVKTLLRKLKAAADGVESTEGPFEELSSALDTDKLKVWTKEAEKADDERGEALDMYSLQMDRGGWFFFVKVVLLIILASLP